MSSVCVYAGLGVHSTIHLYIQHLMTRFDRFIGFEPNPYEFDKIKDQVSHIPGVELHNVAVSDSDNSELSYYISDNHTGSSLHPITRKDEIKDKVSVKTIHLGNFLESCNVHYINLYITDIQGHDLLALKSMEKFLVTKSIETVQTEVHGPVSNTYVGCNNRLIDFLNYKSLTDNYSFRSIAFDGATYTDNVTILKGILENHEYDVTWAPRI